MMGMNENEGGGVRRQGAGPGLLNCKTGEEAGESAECDLHLFACKLSTE